MAMQRSTKNVTKKKYSIHFVTHKMLTCCSQTHDKTPPDPPLVTTDHINLPLFTPQAWSLTTVLELQRYKLVSHVSMTSNCISFPTCIVTTLTSLPSFLGEERMTEP